MSSVAFTTEPVEIDRPATWDDPHVHRQLWQLTVRRAVFRTQRMLRRMRSPRRILATSLALLFFILFLLNGIFILSARAPADPERLRLWLSGGMVIYAMYHVVRCVWSKRIIDLEFTAAERLWLAGAPVQRSSLAVYHISNIVVASLLKTLFLAVVLAFDVNHIEMLVLGIFAALVLLESVRLIIQRWTAGMGDRRRNQMRFVATSIALCVALQVFARVFAMTPIGAPTWLYFLNSFKALGQTAACDAIQWLAIPWMASANLAIADHYSIHAILYAAVSILLLPISIGLLVRVDASASRAQLQREQRTLAAGGYGRTIHTSDSSASLGNEGGWVGLIERRVPAISTEVIALIARQATSVRKYWGTILISFLAPTILCLSPLITGQVTDQWLYVVGGIALCTMLLAPPALRIDFRRDLPRMLLLRSLPVRPLGMVIGQLALPIAITWAFQWTTIAIAACITGPSWSQVIMWTGMLAALAVFTFAAENALFLAYPHHERAQGIAMMIRAKLTFLGKATVMALAVAVLAVWAIACRNLLPAALGTATMAGGAVAATWSMALLAIFATAWCWKRFDLAYDVPPE